MRIKKLWILLVCIMMLFTAVAFTPLDEIAMNLLVNHLMTTTKFIVNDDELIMNGEINSKTYAQFMEIITGNPQINKLIEEQVTGSNDDDTMIKLGYKIRQLGLNTHLRANSVIYSGGVDLFLSGLERTMVNGAIIGVHSWSDGFRDATDYSRDEPEHESNRKYVEDMLGKDDFYWFTIYAAPSKEIYQMTNDEIIKYGIVTSEII